MSAVILYLGPISGTCLDRANALRRLGCTVEHLDLRTLLPATAWVDRVTWRLGGNLLSPWLTPALAKALEGKRYDLCYVDSGEWVTPKVLALLRQYAPKVVNYNIDDPLGPRDGARFKAYRQSLPHYDLNVVVRTENVQEAQALGAKNVLRVYRSADEVSHAPRTLSAQAHAKWDSDVLFLGTWFPERGPFLMELITRGVPLTIRGPNWHKAREWSQLKSHWAGGAISGDDYAHAIQCAKVNLGLLSLENRDMHTTRSLEIPALGGLFCAQRTPEHQAMYQDKKEALFWADAKECAAMCAYALENSDRRAGIAQAGQQRVRANGHYNEAILHSILQASGVQA